MPQFDVYCTRPEYKNIFCWDRASGTGRLPRPSALGDTHYYLTMREEIDLRDLLLAVGDVAVDESGRAWMAVHDGWIELETAARESDYEWAMRQCAARGVRYLSHETYTTATTHEVWIAVEDGSGRCELKLARIFA